MDLPAGLRLIVVYKAARTVLSLAAALALLVALRDGRADVLVSWAVETRRNVGHAVWGELARAVLTGARHFAVVGAALAMDASLTAFEAFALVRGYAWSHWFVVATTVTPLPWEIRELIRHPRPSRVLLLIVNASIVAYLASRAAAAPTRRDKRSR